MKHDAHDNPEPVTTGTGASLQDEYVRLSAGYDRRWRRYNEDVARQLHATGLMPQTPCLLDIGCGTGALLSRFAASDGVGVDPSTAMLCRASHVPMRVCARGERLPFGDARFDTVLSTSALHYADDPAQMLCECRRVLPDGGRLLLVDWCADAWGTRLATALLRLQRRPLGQVLRLRDACAMLGTAGFDVVAARRFRAYPLWGMWLIDARAR